jgi:hypothetical protein
MLAKLGKVKSKRYVDKEAVYKMTAVEGVEPSDDLGVAFMERYDLDLAETEQSLRDVLDNADLDDMCEWPLLEFLRTIDA